MGSTELGTDVGGAIMIELAATAAPYSFLLAVSVSDFGLLIVQLLAVVGGAAIGAVGCGLFLKVTARVVVRQKNVPRPVMRATHALGGLAAGLLVWAWVFSVGGQGGMGGSGGGWWPFGQGGGKGSAVAKQPADKDATPQKKTEPPTEPPRTGSDVVQVMMLGGTRVRDQRFYVLDHEAPRTWDELRQALAERKKQNPQLRDIQVVIYKDSVDRDNPAVTELTRWAKENGFTPSVAFLDQNLP